MQNNNQNDRKYDLSTFRVLVVEDFPFIRELLSSALTAMGVGKVYTAEDGMQGKDIILNHNAVKSSSNIDVVVLDWLMPVMDGKELLNWIRNHRAESIKFLPVIFCSAYTNRATVEDARDNGATEIIVKPVSAEKIASRVQYVINKPRPFIKTDTFFGPDRRRKEERFTGPERRKKQAEVVKHVEKLE